MHLGGWDCVRGIRSGLNISEDSEILVWQDELGQLSVSRPDVRVPHLYRLRLTGQIAVDLFCADRVMHEVPITPDLPQTTLDHFLTDQVLPRVLAHEGNLVVHAGACRCDDRAFIVMGESGRGKSTLVASLDRAGFPLLGDDALVVQWERHLPLVKAVYPSLRLLPDSLDALFSEPPETTQVAHYSPKQRISVPVESDLDVEPLPIAAMFSLSLPSLNQDILIRTMSPAETCIALITNSFALDPTDKALGRKKLEDASRLANAVPSFELTYPRDYARLPDVHAAICRQVSQLANA